MTDGIKWTGDLSANVSKFDDKVKRGMVAAAQFSAPQIESYMKSNAPWNDQTGAARSGLTAQVHGGQNTIAIVLSHSVPYGVYLETRWGGRYAILRPALAYGTPLFAEALRRLVFGR